ncbi:MAG: hypothetical protein VR75_08280 [Hyphomonadaceae bacterium BRH_c29]|nr:MAG: hypothetical protein VR75_08280 [Hyphomonadaceae bacterium BRH_c29]
MQINDLEQAVLRQFLHDHGISACPDRRNLSSVTVTDRHYTGAGFITEFESDSCLQFTSPNTSFTGGEVGAVLNSSIDTGYLLYVRDGYIVALEGYTFGDDWPEQITLVDTYKPNLTGKKPA